MFPRMTAMTVIRQLEKLPARERKKVFAYMGDLAARREDAEDRKAIAAARRDPRPDVLWREAKARLGLK